MSVTITPLLRNALTSDATISGVAALLMLAGGSFIAPLTGLPASLLFWAGAALVPFVVLLLVVSRRQNASKLVLIDIIAINALWVIGSFGLLLSGHIEPNWLGIAFVAAQAITVAAFAELQFIGYRRATATA